MTNLDRGKLPEVGERPDIENLKRAAFKIVLAVVELDVGHRLGRLSVLLPDERDAHIGIRAGKHDVRCLHRDAVENAVLFVHGREGDRA